MNPKVHLLALSSLLAADADAGRLHTRHLQLLAVLRDAPGPLSIGEAAEALALSSSAASRLIDRLVERGMLSRAPSAGDRRVQMLTLTDAGRALDARVRAHIDACLVA